MYLTLAKHEKDPRKNAQVFLSRPRQMTPAHVFRVLIHLDVVEDLMFHHFPREDLLSDGCVPWREFHWQFGKADKVLDDEDLHPPPRYCGDNSKCRQ